MIKYVLILTGILSSALAQVMLKKSSSYHLFEGYYCIIYVVLGALFYIISFALYAYLLKIFDLNKISPIMTIGTMLAVVATGLLVFKETVSTRQVIGIILGSLSILLVVK
ncbi:MAG: hypothetical protein P4M12_05805 [Gammaproteobacteria bacterium]|nr:hypothetical protein [Gammaproteobacteria bacterium]